MKFAGGGRGGNFQHANEAFKASSYGQTEFDEASSDVITVLVNENVGANYGSGCPTNSIAVAAEALASAAGYTPGDYQHTVFFIPEDFGTSCGWGGLARRPGNWVWMRVTSGHWYFLEHEIGHNREDHYLRAALVCTRAPPTLPARLLTCSFLLLQLGSNTPARTTTMTAPASPRMVTTWGSWAMVQRPLTLI